MQVTESQIKKLISGEVQCKFKQLGLNMLLTRLSMNYKKSPTASVVRDSTREVNAFVAKFSAIMGPDFEILSRL